MFKTVFATILAGTIGFTSMVAPTPANADAEFNRALAAIIALGVIANANNKGKQRAHTSSSDYYEEPVHYKKKHHRKKHRHNGYAIPSRCIFKFHTHHGWKRVVGPRCVKRHAPWVSLPQHCKRKIWTDRGKKRVFSKHCLRKKGYFFI